MEGDSPVNSDEFLLDDLCFELDVVKKRQRYPDTGVFSYLTLSYSIVEVIRFDVAARGFSGRMESGVGCFEFESQGHIFRSRSDCTRRVLDYIEERYSTYCTCETTSDTIVRLTLLVVARVLRHDAACP